MISTALAVFIKAAIVFVFVSTIAILFTFGLWMLGLLK